MTPLEQLTNVGKKVFEGDSLYTFEVVKQDGQNKEAQTAIAAASKVTSAYTTSNSPASRKSVFYNTSQVSMLQLT